MGTSAREPLLCLSCVPHPLYFLAGKEHILESACLPSSSPGPEQALLKLVPSSLRAEP